MTPMLRSLALAAAFLVAGSAAAQQTCPATPDLCVLQNADPINVVINGDTTATGARANPDRIYQLQRDVVYLMDSNIRNTGYHLQIVGAEGSGALPQVYTSLNGTSGNRVGDAFFQEGDITFRDFSFSGVLPEDFGGELPNMSTTFVRTAASGFDLIMDGLVVVNLEAQIVRAQSALRKMIVTNTIWANSGWLGTDGTNFGAGKGVDLRDGSIDSLVFRNNTFINYTDRIIRHRSSTGPVQNMVFDHNTILNAVSYHGTLALGQVGNSIKITNNLFYDSFVAGADTSDIVRQSEFDESGEVYANGKAKMTWILSEPNETTDWTISNNVYVVSPEVQAFYDAFSDGGGDDGNPDNGTDGDNDIIGVGPPLTDHILSRISNPTTAFTQMSLDLTNAPDAPVDMVTWYRTETGRTKDTSTFDVMTDDYDRRTTAYYLTDFDPSYPTTSPAYTAGTNGCPVGDLTWFPGVDVDACLASADEAGPEASRLAISNAPNPFRTGTTLRYTLDRAADVTMTVYDALGRQVATLVDATEAAGEHTVEWSAAAAAPGLYVVRLQAGDQVGTHRMLVVR